MPGDYRIGEAAKALGVRVETMRRWERDGKLTTTRTQGGQRTVTVAANAGVGQRVVVSGAGRVPQQQRGSGISDDEPLAGRHDVLAVRVPRDGLAATVEIQAGPHRVLALITREAADEMGLEPGMEATATVKATSVMVELPR